MPITITSSKTVFDAAAIHCRFWQSAAWEKAVVIRDRIIAEVDPEWPHNEFWNAVEELSPRPE